MLTEWRRAGADVECLGFLGWSLPSLFMGLRRWRRKWTDQLAGVISWSTWRFPVVAAALADSATPWVVHAGNPASESLAARLKLKFFEAVVSAPRQLSVAACSTQVAESFRNQPYYRRRPIHVVPNPIPLPLASAHRCTAPDRGDGPRLGMVARLDPIKDHATVLRAMPAILRRHPSATLEFAGDGRLRTMLERLSADLGITRQVRFLGEVRDIPALLDRWDLFVYATTEREGFGNALAEALMAGLPCVVTELPVMREVCGDHAAVFFGAGDPSALASKVDDLLADEGRRMALGRQAHIWAEEHFGSKMIAECYWRLLERTKTGPIAGDAK